MLNHENKLRTAIKQVLREHAKGIDTRATPLEKLKASKLMMSAKAAAAPAPSTGQ